MLRRVDPSPVVALNRAVALGMRDGPEIGLSAIEAVLMEGGLDGYHLPTQRAPRCSGGSVSPKRRAPPINAPSS